MSDTKYVIDIGPVPSLPVAGSDARFPVGRIYCVGRNYADHAREMGHDPDREPPFFFMKAANSIVQNNATIAYPVGTKDVHHEIELVVAIGKGGKNIAVDKALGHVWGYGVGLDMTRRDLQGEAKKMGRPWEMGKSFDESAPCTALRPTSEIGHPERRGASCPDPRHNPRHAQAPGLQGCSCRPCRWRPPFRSHGAGPWCPSGRRSWRCSARSSWPLS